MDEQTLNFIPGLPSWLQALYAIGLIVGNVLYINWKSKRKDKDIEKEKTKLKAKSLLLFNESEKYHNEKNAIINRTAQRQRKTIRVYIQSYLNELVLRYERELTTLGLETKESELLSWAFQGLLLRVKEETMEMTGTFLESKNFRSTDYNDTVEGIKSLTNDIHLFLQNKLLREYSSDRYRVNMNEEWISKGDVEKTVENIYTQSRKEYEEGEGKIGDLKVAYNKQIDIIIDDV